MDKQEKNFPSERDSFGPAQILLVSHFVLYGLWMLLFIMAVISWTFFGGVHQTSAIVIMALWSILLAIHFALYRRTSGSVKSLFTRWQRWRLTRLEHRVDRMHHRLKDVKAPPQVDDLFYDEGEYVLGSDGELFNEDDFDHNQHSEYKKRG